METRSIRIFIVYTMCTMIFLSCNNTTKTSTNDSDSSIMITEDRLFIRGDIEIEPPRTAEPPSPITEEVPEEEIGEEEEPEFVDQTVEEETVVEAPPPSPKKAGGPPPPPPPESEVSEIFKVVEQMPRFPGCENKADPNLSRALENEIYDHIEENDFLSVMEEPLSTFSIDVDYASYTNVRQYLQNGRRPPRSSVRIEEFINYFNYDYVQAKGNEAFSVTSEIASCPWNTEHRLVHIGIKGKTIQEEKLPPSNLVFLIDVSGSMSDYNKLPLLKKAFNLLVSQLGEEDKVAIVVYAGASGLVLPSTSGKNKRAILESLSHLESGGSTAGAAGIHLAYEVAKRNFIKEGNNRVILATDGDFNVGVSSESGLVQLIEEKREEGVFLSVLGFGTNNYQDTKMEQLADNGNGQYAFIDNINEARKVFITEMMSTLHTIAKDVKIQIEFNPTKVAEYRLIGYENRKLKNEDFNNDKKDAGDIGAGHTVTALYEIVPTEVGSYLSSKVDKLKYQNRTIKTSASNDADMITVKIRYKEPNGKKSKLLQFTAKDNNIKWLRSSENFRFSAAVASFAMLLRDSKYRANTSYDLIERLAKDAMGNDRFGYRNEFLSLVDLAKIFIPEEGRPKE